MKLTWTTAVLGVLLTAGLASAQPATPASVVPDKGRPTKLTDEQPLLNFESYFTGKWNFEWDVPEGPLGPAGTIKGAVTYKKIDGNFYEGTLTATGPAGPIKMTELIAYRPEGKTISRWVTDSRGFSYLQIAPVGGDLGGYYNIYYESNPFTYKGKTVRLKHALRLLSPTRFRNTVTIATDKGDFTAYGSPWFEKEMAPAGK
mgnify:CR=1 FL=1